MIAVTEEHEDLRRAVRRWLDTHCPPEVARAAFDALGERPTELPPVWTSLADQGWLGLHVDEEHGGEGFGVLELAVVLDELGRSCAPGPVLSTVVVAGLVAWFGSAELRAEALPGLVDGSEPGAVSLGAESLAALDGVVSGRLQPVLGAPVARWALVPVGVGDAEEWWLLDLAPDGGEVQVKALPALDPSRPVGSVEVSGVTVAGSRRLSGLARREVEELALVLASAECAGGASFCLESSSDYAKQRVQFGRPIGQFQAVKHKLADMLVSAEVAAAAAWDAARAWDEGALAELAGEERSLAVAVAGDRCLEAFVECAKDSVQLHGGIGFTWEHDAHRYLKRAMATRALLVRGATVVERVTELASAGVRRSMESDLPEEAEQIRTDLRPVLDTVAQAPEPERRRLMVEERLAMPHWPEPWGRDAGALEQIVIDQELTAAGVRFPNLGVGAWALPTLIAHGTTEQQERWVRPTLLGELTWCQLFSEPGAGSDLASLSTRAERVEGGWRLTGQKVWTSLAHIADFGICLARTDPDVAKHDGITYFVVDMKTKGLDIRPLRELTGAEMFNEVFLDGVFVPDDAVVGSPGQGWKIARTTLANERVSMSTGSTFGTGVESLLKSLRHAGAGAPPGSAERVGELLCEAQSIRLLSHRSSLRALAGTDPGPGSSVRKLLGAEHEQRVQEYGMVLSGAAASVMDGRPGIWSAGFLATRCLTIAGGTSEVQRNVIAERLLGQPKDPEPGS